MSTPCLTARSMDVA